MRIFWYLGFPLAFVIVWLIQKIHMPKEWDTGNDSSLVFLNICSIFFGIVILLLLIAGLTLIF